MLRENLMNKYSKILKRKIYIALNPYRYKHIVKTNKYIAHALSGIYEICYTNSLEALENSYQNGFRLLKII